MFNTSIIVFIGGWALWFFIDKRPSSLGIVVPDELDTMLDNFQLAFDILSAGFLRAAYVFIWKAHYIVVSIITALLISAIYTSVSGMIRRRRLHRVMWPEDKLTSRKEEKKS